MIEASCTPGNHRPITCLRARTSYLHFFPFGASGKLLRKTIDSSNTRIKPPTLSPLRNIMAAQMQSSSSLKERYEHAERPGDDEDWDGCVAACKELLDEPELSQ